MWKNLVNSDQQKILEHHHYIILQSYLHSRNLSWHDWVSTVYCVFVCKHYTNTIIQVILLPNNKCEKTWSTLINKKYWNTKSHFLFAKYNFYYQYRYIKLNYRTCKRPPRIMNRTVPKIIVISVHTVNRFPLTWREDHKYL
jgi:hypothetical protein